MYRKILVLLFLAYPAYAGEVEALVVDNSGKVGINTLLPHAQLDIKGNVAISQPSGYGAGYIKPSNWAILTTYGVYVLTKKQFDPTASNNKFSSKDAAAKACQSQGARLARNIDLDQAYSDGAQWCVAAWTAEGDIRFPMQEATPECYNKTGVVPVSFGDVARIGANCIKDLVQVNGRVQTWPPTKYHQAVTKKYVDDQLSEITNQVNTAIPDTAKVLAVLKSLKNSSGAKIEKIPSQPEVLPKAPLWFCSIIFMRFFDVCKIHY